MKCAGQLLICWKELGSLVSPGITARLLFVSELECKRWEKTLLEIEWGETEGEGIIFAESGCNYFYAISFWHIEKSYCRGSIEPVAAAPVDCGDFDFSRVKDTLRRQKMTDKITQYEVRSEIRVGSWRAGGGAEGLKAWHPTVQRRAGGIAR